MSRLSGAFFKQDVLKVAPALLGKFLCRKEDNDTLWRQMITETEAYRGEEDLACHAKAGKTSRTSVMYAAGGVLYVYLIYGMYWMLNIVTGEEDHPQATLIRGTADFSGPGILTRNMAIDGSFNKENLDSSHKIWIEDGRDPVQYHSTPRIGVEYAGNYWSKVPWRYVIDK